jgi:hypothetical protein
MKIGLKSLVLVIAVLISISELYSADNYFSILVMKGDCQSKSKSSGKWTKLKVGGKIGKSDIIKVDANSYIAMRHSSSRTAELRKAGVYAADSLEKALLKKKNELWTKYVSFVLGSVTEDMDRFFKSNKKDNTISADVTRSIAKKSSISLVSPQNSLLIDNEISFIWHPIGEADEYVLHINDEVDQPVYKQAVKDTILHIDLNKLNLKNDKFYTWLVTAKTKNGESKASKSFLFFSDIDKNTHIKDTASAMMKFMDVNTNALDNAILASYYERNRVNYKALEHYRKAMELSALMPSYTSLYDAFISKMQKTDN